MDRKDVLARARSVLWEAWRTSSEEIGSEGARALMSRGMLVSEGEAAELERLRVRVKELEAERTESRTADEDPALFALTEAGEQACL